MPQVGSKAAAAGAPAPNPDRGLDPAHDRALARLRARCRQATAGSADGVRLPTTNPPLHSDLLVVGLNHARDEQLVAELLGFYLSGAGSRSNDSEEDRDGASQEGRPGEATEPERSDSPEAPAAAEEEEKGQAGEGKAAEEEQAGDGKTSPMGGEASPGGGASEAAAADDN